MRAFNSCCTLIIQQLINCLIDRKQINTIHVRLISFGIKLLILVFEGEKRGLKTTCCTRDRFFFVFFFPLRNENAFKVFFFFSEQGIDNLPTALYKTDI
jgi:hypothetical protein